MPTFLSTRTETRLITAADGIAEHESVLIDQYGVFARLDVDPDELLGRNGHILGIYMGSVLRDALAENRIKEVHPDFADYLMGLPSGASISAMGAANAMAFINTALDRNMRVDRRRTNALLVNFWVKFIDRDGVERIEYAVVAIGKDNLRPGMQILLDYGPLYDYPSGQIKTEPESD